MAVCLVSEVIQLFIGWPLLFTFRHTGRPGSWCMRGMAMDERYRSVRSYNYLLGGHNYSDNRLALAKAIEHTCNGSTEKRVIGYVTAASMPSRTLQAPQETHPVRIDQPRSKRVSNRTGIKIRNFECPFHPWTLTKSHCRSLSAIICSNDEVAERVGKRVKMEWGFVDIPVISARQSWQKDDGELSNSHAGTRIEFSMEELAYQAVLACEMPQPSQPQIIHIEPHLVEEGHPRD